MTTTSQPAAASASAVTIPAGPDPTTATSLSICESSGRVAASICIGVVPARSSLRSPRLSQSSGCAPGTRLQAVSAAPDRYVDRPEPLEDAADLARRATALVEARLAVMRVEHREVTLQLLGKVGKDVVVAEHRRHAAE